MLDPTERSLLLDALRPPDGYRLDRAIGTTFSLDLQALLIAPLAFAMFDAEMSENEALDPIALLEATRRHANHMSIFCQAGRISVPKSYQRIYTQIEGSVHGVTAPHAGGIFHPKVWALRFTDPGEPMRYRLLILSRNLTFDQSWDTVVRLDGQRSDTGDRRAAARLQNKPLVDFIRRLPRLAGSPLPPEERAAIDEFAAQLRDVEFERPNGCNKIRFIPLGLGGSHRSPFVDGHRRALVISPFLSANLLAQVTRSGSGHVLISRQEALDELDPTTLASFEQVYVLDSPVTPEDDSTDGIELSGLHGKVFVLDKGWHSSFLAGSANATDAGFGRNVEFMVELTGGKARLGVKSVLNEDQIDPVSLLNLLVPYESPDNAPVAESPSAHLERTLDRLRHTAGAVPIKTTVTTSEASGVYSVLITSEQPLLASDEPATLSCWPITLGSGHQHQIQPDANLDITFPEVSFEAITSFIAFQLEASHDGKTGRVQFAVNAELEGAPEDRPQRILSSMLDDKGKVLRYLLFLLADPDAHLGAISQLLAGGNRSSPGESSHQRVDVPLLETMLDTLANNPDRLDPIARLVEDLAKTEEGRQLLPDGFEDAWSPIWAARQELQQ
jgi:mRNA-degrading endonuclease toxin of MazEF toxin-antitoxin module